MSLFVWDSIQLIGEPGPPGAYKSLGRPPQPHTTTLPHREEAASATPTTGDRPPPARRQPPRPTAPETTARRVQAPTSGPSPRPRVPPTAPRPPRRKLRLSVRCAPTMSAAGLGPVRFAFVLLFALCSGVSAGRPPRRPAPVGRAPAGKGRAGGARGVRPAHRPLLPAARLRPGLQRPVPVRGPGAALPRRRQPGAGRLWLLPRVRQAAGRAVH